LQSGHDNHQFASCVLDQAAWKWRGRRCSMKSICTTPFISTNYSHSRRNHWQQEMHFPFLQPSSWFVPTIRTPPPFLKKLVLHFMRYVRGTANCGLAWWQSKWVTNQRTSWRQPSRLAEPPPRPQMTYSFRRQSCGKRAPAVDPGRFRLKLRATPCSNTATSVCLMSSGHHVHAASHCMRQFLFIAL